MSTRPPLHPSRAAVSIVYDVDDRMSELALWLILPIIVGSIVLGMVVARVFGL